MCQFNPACQAKEEGLHCKNGPPPTHIPLKRARRRLRWLVGFVAFAASGKQSMAMTICDARMVSLGAGCDATALKVI